MRHWSLLAASVLLALTAVIHLSGTASVVAWLDGEKADVLALVWVTNAAVWFVVAVLWAYHYFAKRPLGLPTVMATAVIPAITGFALLGMYAGAHPGAFMLLGASALALWSGRKGLS